MAANPKIQIIGIGDDGLDGLTSSARQLIDSADLLVGAESTLARVPAGRAKRVPLAANLDETVARLAAAGGERAVVVLASGDPLFYGVARYLCDKLGKDRFEVVPHVSSMQLAFARVKESWEEAFLTNLTNHSLEHVLERIRGATKVGLFTSEAHPPGAVARALLDRRIDYFSAYVCENLGSPDERVTQGELADIAADTFAPLNVMILVRKPNVPDRPSDSIGRRLFGNPDDAFLQSKPKHGLLTPAEVRAMALAEMDLGPASTVWDIGAGSGSVSIEAAQIASAGTIYAIEMDADDHALIRANAERFGVRNLVPILGRAPDAWAALADPDAVFVGGTGREISTIVELAYKRLRPGGRLVAHVANIENFAGAHDTLQRHVEHVKIWLINLARGTYQLERMRFEALNPTFLMAVVKPRAAAKYGPPPMAEFPQLDVIAVGAHPDDVEIACGGTLAKLVRQGYRVGIIDLTDGEPTPLSPGPDARLEEARQAAEALGVQVRVNLDLPNRRLFDTFEARVALGKELRKYRPKLVLGFGEKTPLASPDHWQAMQITDAAVFYARLTKWDDYFDHLPVHTVSTQLYYTLAFASLGLPPAAGHLVVDIGDTLDVKLAAIRCYRSQFPPAKEHVYERVRAAALNQGTAAGYTAGELFASPRTLGTRDLMHFLFGLRPGDEPRKPDVR